MKSFRKRVLALALGASLLCVSAASAMAAEIDDSSISLSHEEIVREHIDLLDQNEWIDWTDTFY